MVEGVRIDAEATREEEVRLRGPLREDDRVVLDGILNGLVSDLGNCVQRIREAHVPQAGHQSDVDLGNIDGLDGGSWNRIALGIHLRQLLLLLGNVHGGRDDEIKALALRVPKARLLLKVLDHLAQGKALDLQLVEPDSVQLVGYHLAAAAGVDRVGTRKGIGFRKLGYGGIPAVLNIHDAVLCRQLASACALRVLPLVDEGEVVMGSPAFGVQLERGVQLLGGLVELAELIVELAVVLVDARVVKLLLAIGDRGEGGVRRGASLDLLEALVVVALELLGEGVVGINGQNALQSAVGLLELAGLDGVIGEAEVQGGEANGGLLALGLGGGAKFLDEGPRLLIDTGSPWEVLFLLESLGGLEALAKEDGLFLALDGDLLGHLGRGLAQQPVGGGAHEDDA